MSRFNLTFRGAIIDGHDPAQVRARLAEVLAIDDPALLQRCFSGDPVVLRRNLERKEAADLYARLRRLGVHAELVKIGNRGDLHAGEQQGDAPPKSAAALKQAAELATPSAEDPATAMQKAPPQTTTSAAPSQIAAARPAQIAPLPIARDAAALTENISQPVTRRADLAVSQALKAEEAVLLRSKEKELQKLLRAKENEEARRIKAEAQARRDALAREASHKARLEATRQKSEAARQQREKEAEAAARKAERKRLEAEAAAQRKARLELAKAEKAARLEEERAEREREQAREQQRLAAQRVEQEKAEQARLEEKQRLAAAKAARREEEKRKAQEIADRLKVENARRKREQAEAIARRRAEEARKKAEEQAAAEEQRAQRLAMEEQAIQRAAVELAQQPSLKPVEARVRTRLEMPSAQRRSAEDGGRRKRQSGEPNLYSLTPFRNTPAIRARAAQSQRIMRLGLRGAAAALAVAALLVTGQFALSTPPLSAGASALAVSGEGQLLLLADDRLVLHDRAGVSIAEITLDSLGLAALQAPMAFTAAGELLAPGRLATDEQAAPTAAPELVRCVLAESRCELFSTELAGTDISALAVNPVDGSIFIADASAGELRKMRADGSLLARAGRELPAQPALRLDSGLLLVSSAAGPAIGIFRYEDNAFAQQLDEVLLLPAGIAPEMLSGVRDFVWSGEHWWVLLQLADGVGLYRFDSSWAFVDAPALAPGSRPGQLVNWGSKILVRDPTRSPVQRLNSEGEAETPFISGPLAQLRADQQRNGNLVQLAWRIALALSLLAAAACLCLSWLHRARALVYTSCHEQGAETVDQMADRTEWIALAPDRDATLGRRGIAYAVLSAVIVVIAIAMEVSSLQLSAMLLAMTGPAIALLLLHRSEQGHIGTTGNELVLVDHEGMYHLGSGARIHHRGPFLMIDDVTVFTGTRLLPAFATKELDERAGPLAAAGIKVDRTIVTVKLLQARHPLALGAVAIAATSASAIALLSLQGIF